VFDIMSSCITDIFFNTIYGSSLGKASDSTSRVDVYRQSVMDFVSAVRTQSDAFQKIMQQCYKYAQVIIPSGGGRKPMTVAEISETIAHEMVPSDFFSEMSERQRGEIVERAVLQLVTDLSAYVLESENLIKIVHHHDLAHEETIRMLQMHGIRILAAFRDEIHGKFHGKETGAKSSVDVKEMDRLLARMDRLREKYESVREERDGLEEAVQDYEEEIGDLKETNAKLLRIVQIMKAKMEAAISRAPPMEAAQALAGPVAAAGRKRPSRRERAESAPSSGSEPSDPSSEESSEPESVTDNASDSTSTGSGGSSRRERTRPVTRRKPVRRRVKKRQPSRDAPEPEAEPEGAEYDIASLVTSG
jgi:hypothetical protein